MSARVIGWAVARAGRPAACVALAGALTACGDNLVARPPPPLDAAGCPPCGACEACRAGTCVELDDVVGATLALGWTHSLAVDGAGQLWAWGANGNGQLGTGDLDDRLAAVAITGGDGGWRSLAGGSRHSCGVRTDGTLWCWGVNVHGQLGLGDTQPRDTPVQVEGSGWAEVVCGGLHTCARTATGELWCWGANPVGQLGLGDVADDQWRPQRVGGDHDWAALAARARHTCGLRVDGALWCWGDDSDGQVGQGTIRDSYRSPVPIANPLGWSSVGTGNIHTCAIDRAGGLWCWGDNTDGQLGLGDYDDRTAPVPVGADGDWQEVVGGWSHTCGRRAGGLWCWGANTAGQLGLGDEVGRSRPEWVGGAWADVATGGDHSCARDAAGVVGCWGANESGQLGSDSRLPRAIAGRTCTAATPP